MRAKMMMVVAMVMAVVVLNWQDAWAAIYSGGPGASYAMGQMSNDKPVFAPPSGTIIAIR